MADGGNDDDFDLYDDTELFAVNGQTDPEPPEQQQNKPEVTTNPELQKDHDENIETTPKQNEISQTSVTTPQNSTSQATMSTTTTAAPEDEDDDAKPARPNSLYKTSLCRPFQQGNCTFGDRCNFAHGEAELRSAPDRSNTRVKTKLCRFYQEQGTCRYGDRCTFAHGDSELNQPIPSQMNSQQMNPHQMNPQMNQMNQMNPYMMGMGMGMPQTRNFNDAGGDDSDGPPTKRRALDPGRYKTKLCVNWERDRTCRYGDGCAYAHGEQELRRRSANPQMQMPPMDPMTMMQMQQQMMQMGYMNPGMMGMMPNMMMGQMNPGQMNPNQMNPGQMNPNMMDSQFENQEEDAYFYQDQVAPEANYTD